MRGLAPRVPRDVAWQRLDRRGWGQIAAELLATLARVASGRTSDIASPLTPTGPKLPLLETTWLPYYLVTVQMGSPSESSVLTVLVDAQGGRARLADLTGAEWTRIPDAPAGPGLLSADQAEAAARDCLIRAQLARPGWGTRPLVQMAGQCEPVGYPVWAYYFATRAGMLDAKLLDGFTGAPGGPALKSSLLATLAQRQRH